MNSDLNCKDSAALLEGGDGLLVDVRTPAEYATACIPESLNAPLSDLPRLHEELRAHARERRIVLVCRTGRRAKEARAVLGKRGMADCAVLEGGMASWTAEGRPLKEGKGGLPLERQVRIAAGALVAIGVALGYWVHPGFLAIAGFVGCGLVFAGVTDTCGMGMMLARLPFNRVRSLDR